jgi:uncharacterized protein
MRILFALNHPAHFHLFKYSAEELIINGHQVLFVYKQKDILEKLLEDYHFDAIKISEKKNSSKSKLFIIKNRLSELIKQNFNLRKVIQNFRPDLLVGTDISITHVGKFRRIPSIVFNEDDISINKFFCYATYPFADHIISPIVCNVGTFNFKKIPYNGYQKLAYLHPTRFKPDKSKIENIISLEKPFYLIRLVSFSAGHDIEKKHSGLSDNIIGKLVEKLSKYGSVYISSEIPVKEEFKKYLLNINPLDIHHFIYFADLFIGDSQSMIVEAAVLGTPSIRFNSFVGKISVLEELEKKYSLTFGISNNNPELLFDKIDELLGIQYLKSTFIERQKIMLKEKIDLTAFIVWFIENYPESVKISRNNPEYLDRFH